MTPSFFSACTSVIPDADRLVVPWHRIALAACMSLALVGGTHAARPTSADGNFQTETLMLGCQTLAAARGTTLASSNAQMTSQPEAFVQLKQQQETLGRLAARLQSHALWRELDLDLAAMVKRMQRQAGEVAAQETLLRQVDATRRLLRQQLADALEGAEGVNALLLTEGATPAQLMAGSMLSTLLQRIAVSNAEFLVLEGIPPESVFLLGKDPKSFLEILAGLREGNAKLRLTKVKSPVVQAKLTDLDARYKQVDRSTSALLSNLQGLMAVREAHAGLLADTTQVSNTLDGICMNHEGSPRSGLKTTR